MTLTLCSSGWNFDLAKGDEVPTQAIMTRLLGPALGPRKAKERGSPAHTGGLEFANLKLNDSAGFVRHQGSAILYSVT